MHSKLSSWKRNTLSLAGRCVLIQSATSSVEVHTMQTTMLPVSVTSKIDRINRIFYGVVQILQDALIYLNGRKSV